MGQAIGLRKSTKIGPYGYRCYVTKWAHVRMTEEGQDIVNRCLARNPEPIALLIHAYHDLSELAIRVLGRDDTNSACMEGLCRAAVTFDPTMGSKFSSYASRAMRSYVMQDLQRYGVVTRDKSPIPAGDPRRPMASDFSAETMFARPESETVREREEVEAALEHLKLPPSYKDIFRMCLSDRSNAKIGRQFGLSPGAVYNVRLRVVEHLKCHFAGEEVPRRGRPKKEASRRGKPKEEASR